MKYLNKIVLFLTNIKISYFWEIFCKRMLDNKVNNIFEIFGWMIISYPLIMIVPAIGIYLGMQTDHYFIIGILSLLLLIRNIMMLHEELEILWIIKKDREEDRD
jgi:hypothetical protein